MIAAKGLLSSSKTFSRELLKKRWLTRFPYCRSSCKCSLESREVFSGAFIHKNSKKIIPCLGGSIPTYEKSWISCEVTSNFKGSLPLFYNYKNDLSQKKQNQEIMDSIKALFETSDQEDNIDESSDCEDEIPSKSYNHVTEEEMLGKHSICQVKSDGPEEEPSDSQCLNEDDEPLIPLNFFQDCPSDQAKSSTHKTPKNEKMKTKKQERKERAKAKKRKLVHSCSGLEDDDENENARETTDDNNSGVVKKDKSKKRKERKKRKKQIDENESEDDSDHEVIPKKPRPNYFVAVRVSNPAIHSSVKIIQDSMVDFDKSLEPALIPIATLHITVMVMHLKPEEVEKAVEVLKSCENDMKNLFDEALSMTFEELAHFRNEVVFGKINNDEEVEKMKLLATVVRNNYEKNGFSSTDDRPFTPHLTIMKLSRMQRKRKKRVKKIPPESYSSWLDCELGKEIVTEVLLCSMNHEKDKEGFYHSVGSLCIPFGMEMVRD